MATVFIGTSAFAVTVLERLADSPHRPALVLTRPDRPRGRGRHPGPPPAAVAARELGIALLQPDRLGDAFDQIAEIAPTAVLVCAYGALVREPLLSAYEMLNVHPSLVPRWRGAAPIERALMAGDDRTGVSIIRLTAELDSGPIYVQAVEPIAPEDTYGTLAPRLARLGGRLLVETLDDPPALTPQPDEGVTYAEKIAPANRILDPNRTPAELARVVRALDPHIGARIGELRVLAARPAPDPTPADPADAADPANAADPADATDATDPADADHVHPADAADAPAPSPPPGALAAHRGRLLLGAAGGALELLRVQPPGGRPMEAADYLRGHAL